VQPTMIYRINAQNEIIYVDDEWQRFLDENSSAETSAKLASTAVLGRPLWEFISDNTTRQLYRAMLGRVRPGETLRFPLRCDGPDCTRLLEMEIVGGENGSVEFRTTVVRAEKRAPRQLLDASIQRSSRLLRSCSWCNRIDIEANWLEIDEAVRQGHLFEQAPLPALSHAICDDCFASMSRLVA
jgi:hypothetical protein